MDHHSQPQPLCHHVVVRSQIAKYMGPTWGPSWFCRPQMGLMLAPWTLLSGMAFVDTQFPCSEGVPRSSIAFAVPPQSYLLLLNVFGAIRAWHVCIDPIFAIIPYDFKYWHATYAKCITGNVMIYLYFLSFCNINKAQVCEIVPIWRLRAGYLVCWMSLLHVYKFLLTYSCKRRSYASLNCNYDFLPLQFWSQM